MTHQATFPALFESVEDALRDVVRALGGAKKVAGMLWPGMDGKKSERKLLDCLNDDRDHKLSLDEFQRLARWGRDVGCHSIAYYFCERAGYSQPLPITPAEEKAELQRRFIEAAGYVRGLCEQIDSVK